MGGLDKRPVHCPRLGKAPNTLAPGPPTRALDLSILSDPPSLGLDPIHPTPPQMTWDAEGSHPTLLLDSPQGVLSSSLEAAGPLAHRGPGGFPARPGRAEGRGCRDLWGLSACVSCSRPALSFPPARRVLVRSGPCPHLCCFCPLSVSPLGCLMATQPLAGCQALSRHHLKSTSGSASKEQGFHPDTWEGDGRREVGCTWQSQAALGRPRKWLSSCSADLADSLDRTPAPSPQSRWVDSLLSGMWWRP